MFLNFRKPLGLQHCDSTFVFHLIRPLSPSSHQYDLNRLRSFIQYLSAKIVQILQAFCFPDFADERNQQAASRIAQTNSVGIHVRRGDYLTDPLFRGTGTLDYYTQAIRRMKDIQGAARIPIVAMTVNAFRQNFEESMAAGMNAHLVKPIEPEEFYDIIRRLLGPLPEAEEASGAEGHPDA